jgi:hypothetical protein
MNIENWKNRYTVRRFNTEQLPDEEKIKYMSEVINYIPSQNGVVDHQWVLLTPDDQKIKEWLVDNVYNVFDEDQTHREYFTALAEAPYVFHSIMLYSDLFVTLKRKTNEYFRTNGFHAGVLVCEAVELGLDVCQICCNDGILTDNYREEEYKDIIWDRFGGELGKISLEYNGQNITFSKDNIKQPSLSVGVGVGEPLTPHNWTPYKDGVSFTGQKQKKWFNNFVK